MCLIALLTALLWPTARAMRWGSFLTAAAVGLAVVAVPSALTVELQAGDLTTLLRVAAVCAALGTAFLLDDPAEPTVRSVPTPRLVRHALRVGTAAVVVALWWVVALAVTVAGAEGGTGAGLRPGALTLEAAALAATALAVAAVGRRLLSEAVVSQVAAPAMVMLAVTGFLLPDGVAVFVAPDSQAWSAAHARWAGVFAVAAATIALASRDPVRSRLGIAWPA
jgi:hypothetical protein